MTQWKLVSSDGNESEPFDSREAAEVERADLEALGATVKLQEVGSNDDAEVIDMSGDDGGNSTDTDDDDSADVEIIGDGGVGVRCPACNRISTRIYRCDTEGCGHDLAGKNVDEWGDDA